MSRFGITLIYLLLFGLLYSLSGLITSGYHMMEDHEIMINNELFWHLDPIEYFSHVWNESGNRISRGLNVYLAFLSALFGSNWWMWHSMVLVIISVSFAQFQWVSKTLGVPKALSYLLPLTIVAGSGTEIITRLATIESLALLISSSLLMRIVKGKRYTWSLLLVFLLFFSKESFILLGPFILSFAYFIKTRKGGETSFDQKNFLLFSVGVIIIGIGFLVALLSMDVSNTEADYVLTDYEQFSSTLLSYFNHIKTSDWWATTSFPYILILGLLIAVSSKLFSRATLVLVVVGLASILVQFVLLVSVGFSGRYLIPTSIVIVVLFAVLIPKALTNRLMRFTLPTILIVAIIVQSVHSRQMIDEYIDSGRAILKAVTTTLSFCPANCNVLLIGDPLLNIEMFQALSRYLEMKSNDKNISVKILATEPDIDRFMDLAEIHDFSSVARFETGFKNHYKEQLVQRCDQSFDVALSVGENVHISNYCNEYYCKMGQNNPLGQSWYKFQIAQISEHAEH